MADLEYNDELFHAEMQSLIDTKVQEARSNVRPINLSHCLFCQDPLPPKHGQFCDADCRDLYEQEQRNLRVRGRQ